MYNIFVTTSCLGSPSRVPPAAMKLTDNSHYKLSIHISSKTTPSLEVVYSSVPSDWPGSSSC